MKASAFSCADRGAVEHSPGYDVPVFELELDETCMSENTTLPHRAPVDRS